jgi:recombinational DNA repair ATPase RecF
MIRLRQLDILGFRGARFKLAFDFTKGGTSVSVYGENASGKSTITDALEWYLLGRIDHLWREDCKEEALRNVLLGDEEECSVSVKFIDPKHDGTKSLSSQLKATPTNRSLETADFLASLEGERIFLRHAQITKFVAETKSKKRQQIAAIIGYEEIVRFRDTIQASVNSLKKDGGYSAAKHLAEAAKNRLFQLSQSVIATEAELFKKATGLVAIFDIQTVIRDDPSYDDVLEKMHAKISKPDAAEKKIKYERLLKASQALDNAASTLSSIADKFLVPYNKLARNRSAVSQLNIEQFLSQGRDLIDEEHVSGDACPFCLTTYDLRTLRTEVEQRIAKIEALRASYQELEGPKDDYLSEVTEIGKLCKSLAEEYMGLDDTADLEKSASAILPILRELIKRTKKSFESFQPVTLEKSELGQIASAAAVAKVAAKAAEKQIARLQLSKREQQLIETIEQLKELRTQYREYKNQTKKVAAYEKQILSLSYVLDSFKLVQSHAIQKVLDRISNDVGAYYSLLHPDENVDQVKLRVIGDEGIEFEYCFHGKPTYPPMKYLSESHLNSLGICLFLASAKVFNKTTKFLVLDDIVTSFDHGHRRRLLRLLKDRFSDWQIILLTHEHLWFEMVRREFAQSGWQFNELIWDSENGIQNDPVAADWRALIAEKRKKYDVSNDIRKYLEASLKEIAAALEVKVAFRFNDKNENRMSGELLSALRATVAEKSPSLAKHPIFSQLEGSNLVATIGSHDNPGDKIVGGDIDVALNDIDTLANLFGCPHCHRYVETERPIAGQKKVSCRCGKKDIDWKN